MFKSELGLKLITITISTDINNKPWLMIVTLWEEYKRESASWRKHRLPWSFSQRGLWIRQYIYAWSADMPRSALHIFGTWGFGPTWVRRASLNRLDVTRRVFWLLPGLRRPPRRDWKILPAAFKSYREGWLWIVLSMGFWIYWEGGEVCGQFSCGYQGPIVECLHQCLTL